MVYGLCYRMLGHREDAEDVAQEVFLRAFRSLAQWDPGRPLKPWLLTIAANRCRTALQLRSRRPVPAEFVDLAADESAANDEGDLAEELQRALESVRDEYRMCFVLFHQQELSVAEIGQVLDCPVGTVKTWLHRARREIAEHLKRRGFGPEATYELHGV
jgi:RNA polymerase sigma-70 factor (ECF subfamily)